MKPILFKLLRPRARLANILTARVRFADNFRRYSLAPQFRWFLWRPLARYRLVHVVRPWLVRRSITIGHALCRPSELSLVAITFNCETYRIKVSIFFMAARKVLSEYNFVNMFCRSCNLLFRVKCTSEINVARCLANQTAAGNCLQICT